MNTRIKICGITSVADALMVTELGADALGLMFYPPSSRAVTVTQAADIARAAGPFVTVTGVFVNAETDWVRQVLDQVPLQLLQFHGDETPEWCGQFQRPYIKARRVRAGAHMTAGETAALRAQLIADYQSYTGAAGMLLDTQSGKAPGGTGESFNWACVPETDAAHHWILAGGLTPDNVQSAVEQTRPWAVDVSSGVESAAGKKDREKVAAFVRAVKSVKTSAN